MKSRPYVGRLSTLLGLVLLLLSCQVWAQTYSHVRMVRLSFVEGAVTVQRPDVQEWATALVNLPVSEGFKLATGDDGFAEVEFEDTSSARLGQRSLLEFNQLMLSSEGQQVNGLTLQQGYATFHSKGRDVQLFEVRAGNAALVAQGKALFRLDLQSGQLRVIVFKGAVQVTDPSYSGVLTADQALTLLPGENPPFQISRDFAKDAWDEWVAQRESQATSLESRRPQGAYSNDVTSLLYGMNDLDFYGRWSNIPGYGHGWAPNVGPGWIPFSNGRWCWYPRVGYTWISGEPWGWLPYHYGDWLFDPSVGWFWLPVPMYMGTWSPGRVTWYQGPGWVGWTPQAAGGHHMPAHCLQSGNCGTAVSTDAFQSGRFLNPRQRMPVDFSQGARVGQLDVPPNPPLVLPGLPVNWPAGVPDRRVPPPLGQFGVRPTAAGAAAGTAGATVPPLSAGTAPANRHQPHGIPAQRGPVTTPGIVLDPVSGQFVNTPNRAPGAGASQLLTTSGSAAGNVEQLPAQVSPGGLRGEGATKAGQPLGPRGPFQDELGLPRSRPAGPMFPASADSRRGNQASGAAGSGASPQSPPTGSWGVPRSPDRSAGAPTSPRSKDSPSGPREGTSPPPNPGRSMESSGFGRGGGGSPSTYGGSSGPGTGSMPSSPGGAMGTYGRAHGGDSSPAGKPPR